jgi:hypothetical protein
MGASVVQVVPVVTARLARRGRRIVPDDTVSRLQYSCGGLHERLWARDILPPVLGPAPPEIKAKDCNGDEPKDSRDECNGLSQAHKAFWVLGAVPEQEAKSPQDGKRRHWAHQAVHAVHKGIKSTLVSITELGPVLLPKGDEFCVLVALSHVLVPDGLASNTSDAQPAKRTSISISKPFVCCSSWMLPSPHGTACHLCGARLSAFA